MAERFIRPWISVGEAEQMIEAFRDVPDDVEPCARGIEILDDELMDGRSYTAAEMLAIRNREDAAGGLTAQEARAVLSRCRDLLPGSRWPAYEAGVAKLRSRLSGEPSR